MGNKPCNHSDYGNAGLDGKTHFLLKLFLVNLFARNIVGGEVCLNAFVRCGIIAYSVNSVKNTSELVAALVENGIKTV